MRYQISGVSELKMTTLSCEYRLTLSYMIESYIHKPMGQKCEVIQRFHLYQKEGAMMQIHAKPVSDYIIVRGLVSQDICQGDILQLECGFPGSGYHAILS